MTKKMTNRLSLVALVAVFAVAIVCAIAFAPFAETASASTILGNGYTVTLFVNGVEEDYSNPTPWSVPYGTDPSWYITAEFEITDGGIPVTADCFYREKDGAEYVNATTVTPTSVGEYRKYWFDADDNASALDGKTVLACVDFEIEPTAITADVSASVFYYIPNTPVDFRAWFSDTALSESFDVVVTWTAGSAPITPGTYTYSLSLSEKAGGNKSANDYAISNADGIVNVEKRQLTYDFDDNLPYNGAPQNGFTVKYSAQNQAEIDDASVMSGYPSLDAYIEKTVTYALEGSPSERVYKSEPGTWTSGVAIAAAYRDLFYFEELPGDEYKYEQFNAQTIVPAAIPNGVIAFGGDFGSKFMLGENAYWEKTPVPDGTLLDGVTTYYLKSGGGFVVANPGAGDGDYEPNVTYAPADTFYRDPILIDRVVDSISSLPGYEDGGTVAINPTTWQWAAGLVKNDAEATAPGVIFYDVATDPFDPNTVAIGESFTIRVEVIGNNNYTTGYAYLPFTVSKIRTFVRPRSGQATLIYNGATQSPEIDVYQYIISEETNINNAIVWTNDTIERQNVGEYALVLGFSGSYGDTYEFVADKDAKFSIAAATLTPSITMDTGAAVLYGVEPAYTIDGVNADDMLGSDEKIAQGIAETVEYRYSSDGANWSAWQDLGVIGDCLKNVGQYELRYNFTCDGVEVAGEYFVNYVSAGASAVSFEIVKATLDVSVASGQSKVYGSADPTFAFVVGASQYDDAIQATAAFFDGALTRVAGETVGAYNVEQGTLALKAPYASNYDINFINLETFAITKKDLTITADTKFITYYDPIPSFTVSAEGFVPGEGFWSLGGETAFACDYSVGSPVSESTGYAITPSGRTSDNYDIIFVPGVLYVSPKSVKVTLSAPDLTYSDSPKIVTGSYIDVASVSQNAKIELISGEDNVNVGTFKVSVDIEDPNYAVEWSFVSPENYDYALDLSLGATVAEYAITPAAITNASVAQSGVLTYTSAPLTATVSETPATAIGSKPITYAYSDASNGVFTAAIPSFTNAGSHTVYFKANAANHSEATGSFVVSIGKADFTVTPDAGQSKVYGDPDPAFFTYSTSGALGSDVPVLTGSLTREVGEDKGSYAILQGSLAFTNDAVNANYNLDFVSGVTFGVGVANYDMSGVSFSGATVPFDGVNHEIRISGALPAGVTVSYKVGDEPFTGKRNQGSYLITAIFDGDYENYNQIPNMTATLTINPVSVAVVWASEPQGGYVYNGTAQALPVASATRVPADSDSLVVTVREKDGVDFKNQGTYTFVAETANANYVLTNTETSVVMQRRELTLNWLHTNDLVYNGENQKPTVASVEGIQTGDVWGALGNVFFEFQDGNTVDAGAYTGGWALNYDLIGTGADNYFAAGSVDFTILPRPVELTWSASSFTFDGEQKTVTATIDNKAKDSDEINLGYADNQKTFVGTYTAVANSIDNANYTLSGGQGVSKEWSILRAGVVVTLSVPDMVYSKSAKEITGTYEDVNSQTQSATIAVSAGDNVNVGSFTITISIEDDNYKVIEGANCGYTVELGAPTGSATYEITPMHISVKADSKTITYGTILVKGLTAEVTAGEVITGDTAYTLTATTQSGDPILITNETDAGEYPILVVSANNPNYVLDSTTNAVYTINPRAVTYTVGNFTSVYGDAPATLTATLTSGTLSFGDADPVLLKAWEVEDQTELNFKTPVGTYAVRGYSADNNYAVTFVYDGGVYTVTERAIRYRIGDAEAVYGGTLADIGATLAEGSIVEGDAPSYALTAYERISDGVALSVSTGVGEYPIGGEDTDSNYAITFEQGTYTVTKRPITVTYVSAPKTVTYGDEEGWTNLGLEMQNNGLYLSAGQNGLVNGDSILSVVVVSFVKGSAAYDYDDLGPELPAGKYLMNVSPSDTANYEVTVDVDSENDAYLLVGKATYDVSGVTFEDAQFDYDGETHAVTIRGTLPSGVTVSYDGNSAVHSGEQVATAIFAGDYDNYEAIENMTALLTIRKATLTSSVSVSNVTYGDSIAEPTVGNGVEVVGWKGADSVELIDNAFVTIYYAPAGSAQTAADVAAGAWTRSVPKNAGKYYAWLSIAELSDYTVADFYASFTIEKKALTVRAEDKTVVYGEEIPSFTKTIEGFILGETETDLVGAVVLTCDYELYGRIGRYPIEASGVSSENYAISFVGGALTVTARPITVKIDDKTSVYGDAVEILTYKVTEGNVVHSDAAFSVTTAVTPATGVGTYPIVGTKINNNYAITFEKAEYVVTGRVVTLDWGVAVFTYDGTEKAPEANAGNIVNRDILEVTVEGAKANAGSYVATAIALNNPNYLLPAGDAVSKAFVINKAKNVFDLSGVTTLFKWTGSALSIGGVTALENAAISYEGNSFTTVGKHIVTVSCAETANYLAGSTEIEVTVEEADPTQSGDGAKVFYKEIDEQTARTSGADVTDLFRNAKNDPSEKKEVKAQIGSTSIVFNAAAIQAIGGKKVALKSAIRTEDLPNGCPKGTEFVLDIVLEGSTFAEGEATVSTAYDKKVPFGKTVKVYYIDENGGKTDMKASLKKGVLTFSTNHFSSYAVVQVASVGVIVGVVAGGVAVLAGIAFLVIFLLKKKGEKKYAGEKQQVATFRATPKTPAEGSASETESKEGSSSDQAK